MIVRKLDGDSYFHLPAPEPQGEQNPHPKEYPPIVRIAQGFGNQMKAAVIFAGAKLKALKPF